MGRGYIERFQSFSESLDSLAEARNRDLSDSFVLSGTVQKFSLTFDIAWKVMKDIIVNYHKISDFATGSPRETLRTAASVRLIFDDDWMQMLNDRNALTHDYNGALASKKAAVIVERYIPLLESFRETARPYLDKMDLA